MVVAMNTIVLRLYDALGEVSRREQAHDDLSEHLRPCFRAARGRFAG